jgi:hypothetical protein
MQGKNLDFAWAIFYAGPATNSFSIHIFSTFSLIHICLPVEPKKKKKPPVKDLHFCVGNWSYIKQPIW